LVKHIYRLPAWDSEIRCDTSFRSGSTSTTTKSSSLHQRESFNATAKNAITNTCPSNDTISASEGVPRVIAKRGPFEEVARRRVDLLTFDVHVSDLRSVCTRPFAVDLACKVDGVVNSQRLRHPMDTSMN
jgi:hypothetical protein